MPSSRPLVRVPVPPGADGPQRLLPALLAALDGSGPAIAPIPVAGPTISSSYVGSLLAATRPDDADLPLESDDVAVVVATSGSTGDPRGVLLTASALTSLTAVVNGRDARPQWIVALPVTAIGGLNVLLRSLPTDLDPVVLPSIGGGGPFTATAFHAAVEAARGRTDDVRVSLVPAQLARLLDEESGIAALRECAQILVGGAALRPSLRTRATVLGLPVTTTYGGTETSGGCVYDGSPLPGVAVTVESPDPDTGEGRLVVSGPNVGSGYRGEPSAAQFRPGGFLTSDVGVVNNGKVAVIGRADDVVTVGGVNVSPSAVESAMTDVAGVRAAAVVVREFDDGPRLWAYVECDVAGGSAGLPDLVRSAVARQLGPAARPRAVRQVDRLPHLPNGKVDRVLIREWAALDEVTD